MGASNLDILRLGAAYFPQYSVDPGVEFDAPIYYHYGAIAAADRDGLVQSVNPADGATFTLRSTVAGMTNSGGVVTLDTPRNVTIYGTADESAKSILVTGTCLYGQAMTEAITGMDGTGTYKLAEGKKAFKTISSIVATGNFGTIEIGFGCKIGLPFRTGYANRVVSMINGKVAAPHTLTATITAIGTAQDTAVIDTIGGTVTVASGVSAAANGTASSTVTLTNPSALQGSIAMGTIVFGSTYSALAAQASGTLVGKRLAANGVIKATTDGTGDGAGQATITIEVDPAVITVADDTATATTTTGDVRGTIDFGHIPDASQMFSVLFISPDRTTKELCFGVAQA